MKLDVAQVTVWAASLEDRPGNLAAKLKVLADAGANLEFVIARRESSQPGTGVVFVTPLKGVKQTKAAAQAGFAKAENLHSVRVAGPDKPGLGVMMTQALAEAGINLRGLSAGAIGKRGVVHLALDSVEDAKKALRVLKAIS